MKSKFSSKLFLLALAIPAVSHAQVTGDFRSASAGDWANGSGLVWEKYDGTAWNASTSKPGSAANVTVQHALTIAATSNSATLTVQSGASIKWGGTTTAASGLRVYATSLVNNGTIGGGPVDDSINLEIGGSNMRTTISGTGTIMVNRLRVLGGVTGNNTIFATNASFTNQSASLGSAVGISAYYGSSSLNTDVDTVTINPGVTVTFYNAATLHYQSVNNTNPAPGQYSYYINGILDMSRSTGTTYISPASNNAAASVTLNVAGLLKLGSVFSTMDSTVYTGTATTPGSVHLNVAAGGVVDATPTDFKMDLTYGPLFNMASNTAIMKRYINSANFAVYPISISDKGNNTLAIQNAGSADTFAVSIQAFSNAAVTTDLTKVVNRQWTIKEVGTGGKMDSLKFTWLTAEQGSAVGTTPSVYVHPATGTTVEYTTATISGTGTATDPYKAILGVTAGMPAGIYYIGKPGLPTAVTNVANEGDLNVTVAPNPTTNKQISFRVSGSKAGTYRVAVYNMLGQTVYSNEINYNANTTTYKVDLGNMPTGIYQLHVSNGQENIGNRVVVE